MKTRLSIFLIVFLVLLPHGTSAQSSSSAGPWQMQTSTTKSGLRGIHAVGGGVAWASGTDGTVLRTEDDGYIWQLCAVPPGAEKLDFRGVWAWDANVAVAMSSGPGELSRLYKTTDGCSSWKLLYTNPDKDGFWDAVAFWDKDHGLILGDPVEDSVKNPGLKSTAHFVLLQTDDGGQTWKRKWPDDRGVLPGDGLKGAGAFAASNSSLTIHPAWAWFGIGSEAGSFVYLGHQVFGDVQRADGSFESMGFAWMPSIRVPISSGNASSGVFSIAFRDEKLMAYDSRIATEQKDWSIPASGIAVGGDYKKPEESAGTAAYTSDGGKTWTAAAKPPHGFRSAVAWDAADKAWIAAGTNGSDVSFDDGKTWVYFDSGKWNALSLPWVVGPEGRIGKLVSLKLTEIGKK